MNLIRRKPWIPVLLFYLSFLGVWIWFAWVAVQNSPQVVPDPPARARN